MRQHKKPLVIVCLALLILLASACNTTMPTGPEPAAGSTASPQVAIVVSRDFGREILLAMAVDIEPGTDAMTALKGVAEVETKYGGGFVSSINGIRTEYQGISKGKNDWFFYINGISCNTGAKDYILQDGDVEQWDFRDWSYRHFVPAIIGSLPQPFTSTGGRPATIAYEPAFREDAEMLLARLREWGVSQSEAVGFSSLTEASQSGHNLILIGEGDNPLIEECNNAHYKLGFYARFEGDRLIALDQQGEPTSEYEDGVGLIQATQNPWNPKGIGARENVVWLITGTDEEGIRDAIDAVVNRPDDLRHLYAAIIVEDEIIGIPQ